MIAESVSNFSNSSIIEEWVRQRHQNVCVDFFLLDEDILVIFVHCPTFSYSTCVSNHNFSLRDTHACIHPLFLHSDLLTIEKENRVFNFYNFSSSRFSSVDNCCNFKVTFFCHFFVLLFSF